jgi:hypothetical protein
MTDLISRYFGLDAQRDREGIVSLFADDAIVVDEGTTYRGTTEIRAWQLGPASKYVYTTEVLNVEERPRSLPGDRPPHRQLPRRHRRPEVGLPSSTIRQALGDCTLIGGIRW